MDCPRKSGHSASFSHCTLSLASTPPLSPIPGLACCASHLTWGLWGLGMAPRSGFGPGKVYQSHSWPAPLSCPQAHPALTGPVHTAGQAGRGRGWNACARQKGGPQWSLSSAPRGRRDFAGVISIRTLRCGDHPRVSGRALNVATSVLVGGRKRDFRAEEEVDGTMEARGWVTQEEALREACRHLQEPGRARASILRAPGGASPAHTFAWPHGGISDF